MVGVAGVEPAVTPTPRVHVTGTPHPGHYLVDNFYYPLILSLFYLIKYLPNLLSSIKYNNFFGKIKALTCGLMPIEFLNNSGKPAFH